MSTFLFHDIIFGPIQSRRLGTSLGVNLLPTDGKLCNFDCIYCECGWTGANAGEKLRFNPKEEVIRLLEEVLRKRNEAGEPLDVITFAGNGEPTMHPDFPEIIDRTLALRDRYFPQVKVAVLSNATMLGNEKVRRALARVDQAILKIDSAFDETIREMDNPRGPYTLEAVLNDMALFEGEIIVQTMFLRGERDGRIIDNTTDREVEAWIGVLRRVRPAQVMIYSLDRDTPLQTLSKVPREELEQIGKKVGAAGFAYSIA